MWLNFLPLCLVDGFYTPVSLFISRPFSHTSIHHLLVPFKFTSGTDHILMIDGFNLSQAPFDYIKVARLKDPLEVIGWSLGDSLCVNSSIYPKRLPLNPFISPSRDEVFIIMHINFLRSFIYDTFYTSRSFFCSLYYYMSTYPSYDWVQKFNKLKQALTHNIWTTFNYFRFIYLFVSCCSMYNKSLKLWWDFIWEACEVKV